MMAKIRHIAIAVQDPKKTAQFYMNTFGLKQVGETDSPLATGVYLSDGYINVALLKYKTDDAAGKERGKDYVGMHHFGFQVEDLKEAGNRIEDNGGSFFLKSRGVPDFPRPRRREQALFASGLS